MNGRIGLRWAKLKDLLRQYLIASIWVYFTFMGLWILGHLVTGDRYVPVALLTILGPHLFLPLFLVLPVGLLARRADLLAGVIVGAAVFVLFWGSHLLPKSGPPDEGPSLTVMTYNVLGSQGQTDPVVTTLRATGADLVFLQEVTPGLAHALASELSEEYPHQILQPERGVSGLGVVSRYPLRATGETLPLNWVGEPQILRMRWAEEEITLVHFHSWAIGLATFEVLEHNFRLREAQALVLSNFVRQETAERPVVVAGDLNTVDRSDAYRRVTGVLRDAWQEGGWGFGHTFPGSDVAGSSRPRLMGVSMPRWMARIDYIFHSDHWRTEQAWLAPFDGVSDHRGVLAALVFSP